MESNEFKKFNLPGTPKRKIGGLISGFKNSPPKLKIENWDEENEFDENHNLRKSNQDNSITSPVQILTDNKSFKERVILKIEELQKEFLKTCTLLPFPTILCSQLYSLLNDRTLVDQTLNELKKSNEIRLFKNPSNPNHDVIMKIKDIESLFTEQIKDSSESTLCQLFLEKVTKSYTGSIISLQQLKQYFLPHILSESDIRFFFQKEFMVGYSSSVGQYCLSFPDHSRLWNALRKAEQIITSSISRRSSGNTDKKSLEKLKTIQKLDLSVLFLTEDLIGRNIIVSKNNKFSLKFN